MKLSTKIRAGAFALGLAAAGTLSAATTSGNATSIDVTIALNQSEDYSHFVYSVNGGADTGVMEVGGTDPFTGASGYIPSFLGTIHKTESIPTYITSGVGTMLGEYRPGGVSVAVNTPFFNQTVNAKSWNDVFPSFQESAIASALEMDTPNQSASTRASAEATLLSFMQTYASDLVSFQSNNNTTYSAGILNFSNATNGGTLSFSNITASGTPPTTSATPEPSTELLMGAGFGVVALALRRFRKA